MSNIYIQEPPTSGKVLLKTSAGDIDIELWCRETPKTCRNFIQLCMEGYYNNTIFHRLVQGFIVQGGDPNGDGSGGESVYGGTFKDEFHSRLRFIRRGLVAMANAGRDDNGSQFFFTLGEASELQNKHTLFGKVTGDTVFNMLKLEDGVDVDQNERPLYPHRILKTEVLLNPFEDIVPRVVERKRSGKEKKKKEKGVKNFGLLSFGNEAEEDEEQTIDFVQKNAGKAKSTHDVLDDPKLSKDTATFVKIEKDDDDQQPLPEDVDDEERSAALKDSVRNKLQAGRSKDESKKRKKDNSKVVEIVPVKQEEIVVSDSDSDEFGNELERERRIKRKKAAEAIREEINALKKDYQKDKRSAALAETAAAQVKAVAATAESVAKTANPMFEAYLSEQRKYAERKQDVPGKKDAAHELQTLELLARFKSKLNQVMFASSDEEADSDTESGKATKKSKPESVVRDIASDNEDDIAGDDWLGHTLRFEEKAPVLAKDASTKRDDWYDAFDPRNPLNKRKRGDEGRGGGGRGGRDEPRRGREAAGGSSSSSSRRSGGGADGSSGRI